MKQICAGCEDKLVYVSRPPRRRQGRLNDHDLCTRCFKSLCSQIVAARMSKKPNWAVRATLKLMAEALGKGTGC